jgi:3-methyladenine DNA glycosylase AlkD
VESTADTAQQIRSELLELVDHQKASDYKRFFKTAPGQYGAGDLFLGITVPDQRGVARRHLDMPLGAVVDLLHSPEHEFRLTALMLWAYQCQRGSLELRHQVVEAYLANTAWVNNWDLVDASAPGVLGQYLLLDRQGDIRTLRLLAASESLWERRIAMVSTAAFIRRGSAVEALEIAEMLLGSPEDLLQKAVGWMLREVGKYCGRTILTDYLASRHKTMPRTTLRYAIEHYDLPTRQLYLKGQIELPGRQ